jgi:hypothetical protein
MQQTKRENYICGKLFTESKIFFCFYTDNKISPKFTETIRNASRNDKENDYRVRSLPLTMLLIYHG